MLGYIPILVVDCAKNQVEDMFHVISSCIRIFPRYYLPLRHDAIKKYLYEQHRMK